MSSFGSSVPLKLLKYSDQNIFIYELLLEFHFFFKFKLMKQYFVNPKMKFSFQQFSIFNPRKVP